MSLALLLLGARPHGVPLVLHPGGGDVHEVHLNAERLENHDNSVLVVGDLRRIRYNTAVNVVPNITILAIGQH